MAWFLFIDESGHDRKASPYEVLAGVAIQDRFLWSLVNELHEIEVATFGRRYSAGNGELKGTKLLKTKVFQQARLNVAVAPHEIPSLAKAALDDGAKAGIRELKGLALAKLRYVEAVFTLCEKFMCRVFASVVETDAPSTTSGGLRKDYAYLFERFFYFLQDYNSPEPRPDNDLAEQGIIVFDELEKTKSHLLIDQTHRYFEDTSTGRRRASLIVPEPIFVHSDLTTGVQIADLVAYCISWGFRTNRMTKPARTDLVPLSRQVARLRYRAERHSPSSGSFVVWSIAHITDLRTTVEKLDEISAE
jgi:hypothetical protein